MVRLVKGAYWDTEIKRAQVDGLAGYPVFTRKVHTDVAYLACARRCSPRRTRSIPQFATHNALTLAAVHTMAGRCADYEFQCLHGMGEPLYDQVVGERSTLDRPCRIYAPVGTHETLLAYLVRRLLENGANTSFVNRIADPAVPSTSWSPIRWRDARASVRAARRIARIPLPRDLYVPDAAQLAAVSISPTSACCAALAECSRAHRRPATAAPMLGATMRARRRRGRSPVRNPADHATWSAPCVEADRRRRRRTRWPQRRGAGGAWSRRSRRSARGMPRARRRPARSRARDASSRLAVREAGKTLPNAVAEVREAVDFCRYYARPGAARELRRRDDPMRRASGRSSASRPGTSRSRSSPARSRAALAAGNAVLAKPAEQTPLIAATAVRLFHRAGVPRAALQLLPGRGDDGRRGAGRRPARRRAWCSPARPRSRG